MIIWPLKGKNEHSKWLPPIYVCVHVANKLAKCIMIIHNGALLRYNKSCFFLDPVTVFWVFIVMKNVNWHFDFYKLNKKVGWVIDGSPSNMHRMTTGNSGSKPEMHFVSCQRWIGVIYWTLWGLVMQIF